MEIKWWKPSYLYVVIGVGVAVLVGILWLLFGRGDEHYEKLSNPEQEAYLMGIHEKERNLFRKFLSEIEKNTDWKVIITSGYRTFAKQAALKETNDKNASPGHSYHNYGLAIDINLIRGGEQLKMASSRQKWLSSGVPQIAAKLGFSWGGDFKDYHDPVHFDLRKKYDIDDLVAKAVAQFGKDPSKVKGNQLKL